jgi:hypothetical protein
MSKIDQDDKAEPPLDPVLEKVRRKMIRLQLVSAGVMVVALMAVLAAIVYKANRLPATNPPQSVQADVPSEGVVTATASLPAGFILSSMQLANGQILFDGTTAEGTRKALVFDTRLGRIVADITVSKP